MDDTAGQTGTTPPTVGAFMSTELVTATPDTPVAELARLLREHRIRHLPIVGSDGRLRGLVSNRDMLVARASNTAGGAALVASHIMTRQLITAAVDDSVRAAGARLLEHKLGCLPVVDPSGHLMGILSESDFIRMVVEAPQTGPKAV